MVADLIKALENNRQKARICKRSKSDNVFRYGTDKEINK